LAIKNNSSISVWLSAARLRTLPLSVSGILIGSSYAYYQGFFDVVIFIIALLTTVSYQLLSNFANDYGDGIKGSDLNRIGPKRAVQTGSISKSSMKKVILLFSIISMILTFALVGLAFGLFTNYFFLFISMGSLAVYAAIKYTVGKFAYGYFGLGDFFVFIFFGMISVLGSNFLYGSILSLELLFPSIILGLLSVGVLNLNNMRDLLTDKKCNKKTLAVFMGPNKARFYHSVIISISVCLMIFFQAELKIDSFFLNFLLILIIIGLVKHLFQTNSVANPKDYDAFLKPLAINAFFYSLFIASYYFKLF
jgi:1,4-dihydroxy-2-naphthoate octaprenyltransferase